MKTQPILSVLILSILIGLLQSCSEKSPPSPPSVDPPVEQVETEKVAPEPEPAPLKEEIQVPEPEPDSIARRLGELCAAPEAFLEPYSQLRSEVLTQVFAYYEGENYLPVWFQEDQLIPQTKQLSSLKKVAHAHALNPAGYFTEEGETAVAKIEGAEKEEFYQLAAQAELALTLSVTSLAYDLRFGSLPYEEIVSTWEGFDKEFNLKAILRPLTSRKGVRKTLEGLSPQHSGYQQLKRALATYRDLAESGGWEAIDPSLLNRIKDREIETGSYELVPLLRDRLVKEGYELEVPEDPARLNYYDDSLKDAVRQMQANRGLDADGIVGPLTLKTLNVPVEDLIAKITWSMDRWRWLPDDFGDRHILVNVPEFKLRAYEGGQLSEEMGVIVGDSSQGTWTPLFADQMEYVIFRPYWNVPNSIIKGEILPEVEKSRSYLKKFNYEIVDRFSANAEVFSPSRGNVKRVKEGELKIRQTAGPYNALGLVKFIFPNKHSVYLHDTNQRGLFVNSKRDFSHGCIRVQKPEQLALYALPTGSWPESRVREAMYEGERQHVSVGEPIPVYIFYLTAFANDLESEGPIAFFEDLYYYDAKMTKLSQDRKPALAAAVEPIASIDPAPAENTE
ncbi:MAG: L,D-transpeptidase family protein [Verrucomicrobiota bacterium]